VNYLLPHIQRVPSRIVRDELAEEIAQKLAIDSAVLRQDLRHAAVDRKNRIVHSSTEAQSTDAEKILVRALAGGRQLDDRGRVSDRSGADLAFDPARQARYVLSAERLHAGLGTESLVDALLKADPDAGDIMEAAGSDDERRLLASILMTDEEELTAEKIEGAVRALRRMQIRRQLEHIQTQIETARGLDPGRLRTLMDQKLRLKRALMSPNPGGEEITAGPAE
jgi:DNA primase